MNTDIRISTSFKGHRKRKRLKRLLGPESDSYLIDLWLTVSTDCPDGHMVGWDEVDIADACGWDGNPKKLVDALIECNWIEKDMHGEYAVHDWCIHQAWACKAGERSEIARKAAETRWKNKYAKDAESMHGACGENAKSNAPIPSLPIPSLPNEKEKKQSPPPAEDTKKDDRERIIKYLNAKLGTSYKPNSIKTKSTIEARLNEGFNVASIVDLVFMEFGLQLVPRYSQEYKDWSFIHRMAPGADRAKLRSKTFPGIANAMAEQWG